ncbi:MAG TPA: signal peptidase II [Rhizomicrobium sp.]|nr:signal peptidase II [Rhizomicrobium sp.]
MRWLAFGLAGALAAANILVIQLMWGTGATGRVLIPGLADFRPAFNRGVSFGLLTPDSAVEFHFLIALLVTIVIAVAFMAWRAGTLIASAGFGLILGGALGNLFDRLLNGGAVFDFLDLHLGKLPLFVCNFADVAISAGVVLLLVDSLFPKDGAKDPRLCRD